MQKNYPLADFLAKIGLHVWNDGKHPFINIPLIGKVRIKL